MCNRKWTSFVIAAIVLFVSSYSPVGASKGPETIFKLNYAARPLVQVEENLIVSVLSGKNLYIRAIQSQTGEEIWSNLVSNEATSNFVRFSQWDHRFIVYLNKEIKCMCAFAGTIFWSYKSKDYVIAGDSSFPSFDILSDLDRKQIVCLDNRTGKELWSKSGLLSERTNTYAIRITQNSLLVSSDSDRVVCLSADKGVQLWSYDTTIDFKVRDSIRRFGETTLLVCGYSYSNKGVPTNRKILYINSNTGEVVWKKSVKPESNISMGIITTPFSSKRLLLAGYNSKGEKKLELAVLDPKTGNDTWTATYDNPYSLVSDFNDVICQNTYESLMGAPKWSGDCIGIDPKNGKVLWKIKNGQAIGVCSGNPVLLQQSDYGYSIKCVAKDNGATLFTADYDGEVADPYTPTAFLVMGNILYASLFDMTFAIEIKPVQQIVLSYTIGDKKYKVGTETREMTVAPFVEGGRAYIPPRYVLEPLGGKIESDMAEKLITATLGDTSVLMWIGNPKAKVNGKETMIDPNNPKVVPVILDGRTMVPFRFLAETLGCQAKWDAQTKEITLTYQP